MTITVCLWLKLCQKYNLSMRLVMRSVYYNFRYSSYLFMINNLKNLFPLLIYSIIDLFLKWQA